MFELAIYKSAIKSYLLKGMTKEEVINTLLSSNIVCNDIEDLVDVCIADLQEVDMLDAGWVSNKASKEVL